MSSTDPTANTSQTRTTPPPPPQASPQQKTPASTTLSAEQYAQTGAPSLHAHKEPRITFACEFCRQRKIKCDGGKPCGNCVHAQVMCIVRKERKKREIGLKDQKIKNLERQVRVLEDKLATMSLKSHALRFERSMSAGGPSSQQVAPPSPGLLGPTASEPALSKPHQEDTFLVDEDGGEKYIGSSSGLSLAYQLQNSELGAKSPETPGSDEDDIEHSVFMNFTLDDGDLVKSRKFPVTTIQFDFALPSTYVMESLIDAYFEHVQPIYPILDRDEFRQSLPIVLEREQKYDFNIMTPMRAGSEIRYLQIAARLQMVLALGEWYLYGADKQYHSALSLPGWEHFTHAFNASHVLFVSGGTRSLQCLLLIAIYLQGSSKMSHCYILLGTLVRILHAMGVHRDRRNLPDAELRRRLFHISYNLERSFALSLGRPCAMQAFDCDMAPPTPSGLTVEGVDVFAEEIRLTAIRTNVQYMLYGSSGSHQQATELLMELDSWKDGVQGISTSVQLMPLLLQYYQLRICILRSSAGDKEMAVDTSRECLRALSVSGYKLNSGTWLVLYPPFTAAAVLYQSLLNRSRAHKATSGSFTADNALFHVDLDLLSSASSVLKNCSGYASAGEHLARVVRRWLKTLQHGDTSGSEASPSSTSQVSCPTPATTTTTFLDPQLGGTGLGQQGFSEIPAVSVPFNDPMGNFNTSGMDLTMPNWLDVEGDILSMGGFQEWNWGIGDPNTVANELRGMQPPS